MLARAQEAPVDDGLVADRYRIEAELGRGGAAAVLQAEDTVGKRRVALKRLLNAASKHKTAAFQREFYTLSGLRHRGIVQVFDYGVDAAGPYYTMELLHGADLRTAAPMPWREVCRCLRDVASILAVLHARRLVHGDVSPRNLFRTDSGELKLIDFGSLSPFGVSRPVVGTPPFVPPELLQGQPLDQGTDIYALGALGYWLLTGVHAYPARSIGDLREQWRHAPEAPSQQLRKYRPELADVPEELDQLLLSCLSADPAVRCTHAVELMERVSAIAALDAEADDASVEGCLQSKAFVGRGLERELLTTELKSIAKRGRGACFVFESQPGMGTTRFLSQVAVEARLHGATTLFVSSQRASDPFGAVQLLASRLLDALPEVARKAAKPYVGQLGHISPELHERLGADVPLSPRLAEAGENRMRMQAALRDWFLSLAREQLLCVLVDDAHAIDEESAAFFASLAEEAAGYRLMLVAALKSDEPLSPTADALCSRGKRMRLYKLEPHELEELLGSIFGNVPHLSALSDRLSQLSQGNPAFCLELVEELVRGKLVRYADGMWLLPSELKELTLPKSRTEALEVAVERLSAPARDLARVLSVHRGRLSAELCTAVSQMAEPQAFEGLRELVREGVLRAGDDGYVFAHERQRQKLLAELPAHVRRDVHKRLGHALGAAAGEDHAQSVRAALHLMKGGEALRAQQQLAAACYVFTTVDRTGIGPVLHEMEELIALLRAEHASDHELITPLAAMCVAGAYIDRRAGLKYGASAMAAMTRVLKLKLATTLGRFLGKKLGLIVALIIAGVGLRLRSKRPLVPTLENAVLFLCSAAPCLVGLHTMLIDPETAQHYTDMIEPLAALGENHATYLNHQVCLGFVATNRHAYGKVVEHWSKLIPRIESFPYVGLPAEARVHVLAGSLLAWGSKECWRDGQAALRIADRLDKLGLRLYEMSANQLRAMYYAFQGQPTLADYFKKRVDIAAIQRGAAWQVELWTHGEASLLARRTHDLTLCKRAIDALERFCQDDVPSIMLELQRTRGSYLVLRGQYEEGRAFIEGMANDDPTRIGWMVVREMLARAYNGLGQHEKARDICLDALRKLDGPEELTFVVVNLGVQLELALAYAGLGEHDRAASELDKLIAQHTPNEGPLTLVALHETRARVALAEGDDAACKKHIERMEHWAMPTGLSPLIARAHRLQRALKAKNRSIANLGLDESLFENEEQLLTRVQHILNSAGDSLCGRAERALMIARELSGFEQGFVMLRSSGTPLAHVGPPPTEDAVAWVITRLGGELGTATDTDDPEGASSLDGDLRKLAGLHYRVAPLSRVGHNEPPLGALVLASHNSPPRAPAPDLLRAFAAALHES